VQLDIYAPTPLEYFQTLVSEDEDFPLLEAAICIAQIEHPRLDIQQILADVDQLIVRLQRRIPQDASALLRLRTLQQFFYRDLSFCGNENNYYEPDNSYLNKVLITRRGIPISIAVIWIEIAQAIGLKAHGVSFPGHFMIKVSLTRGQVIIDPLSGQSLSKEELSERLEPYKRSSGLIDDFDAPLGLYLQSAKPREIIVRMLRNLKEIFKSQKDWPRFIAVENRLIATLPQAWPEYRDRGLALMEMDEKLAGSSAALADLELYLANTQGAIDTDAITELVENLRRK